MWLDDAGDRAKLCAMPRDDVILSPSPPWAHQRARGRAELVLGPAIRHLYHAAPLRWLFPEVDPGDPRCGALVNVAGGLAGGDSLEVSLRLRVGARFTATTPAAEKIYRSLGPATCVRSDLSIAAGAVLEWLPQEGILFDGARLDRRTDVSLDGDARLLAAEMLVLGREARGEVFARGSVLDRWRVRRDGRLLWADALRLDDPAAARADRFALGGAGAVATILLAAPDAAAHRDRLRDLTGGGASLVAPGLLAARLVGEAGAVRAATGAALAAVRHVAFGHPARLPRLWRT
jgi:urease accessory protein